MPFSSASISKKTDVSLKFFRTSLINSKYSFHFTSQRETQFIKLFEQKQDEKKCHTTSPKTYQELSRVCSQTKFLISQIFSVSLQFWACLHCGSVWRVQSKECYFKVYFLGMFLLIFIKNFVFIISFFDEVSNQKPKLGPPHVLSHRGGKMFLKGATSRPFETT